MEGDESEETERSDRRRGVDQDDCRRYDPDHAEAHRQPAKALAEGR